MLHIYYTWWRHQIDRLYDRLYYTWNQFNSYKLLLHVPLHYIKLLSAPLQIQWNLSSETTAMKYHLSWRIASFEQKVFYFSVNKPVTKDHLSWETIFYGQ